MSRHRLILQYMLYSGISLRSGLSLNVEIYESKRARKALGKAPIRVVKSYDLWARFIKSYGTDSLKVMGGYNDEKLLGDWKGHRSCRLSKQWRVIYRTDIFNNIQIIDVVNITPHDYRRRK